MALLTPDEVVIEDTWTRLRAVRHGQPPLPCRRRRRPARPDVPARSPTPPCLDEPIVRIPPPTLYCVLPRQRRARHRAGRARRHRRARRRTRCRSSPTRRWPPTRPFQFELATADTELRAGRALLYETAATVWASGVEGTEPTMAESAHGSAPAAVWATDRAAASSTRPTARRGSSLYAELPLQRRLRDIHAADPALPRPARHDDDRRRHPRRQRGRRAAVLTFGCRLASTPNLPRADEGAPVAS